MRWSRRNGRNRCWCSARVRSASSSPAIRVKHTQKQTNKQTKQKTKQNKKKKKKKKTLIAWPKGKQKAARFRNLAIGGSNLSNKTHRGRSRTLRRRRTADSRRSCIRLLRRDGELRVLSGTGPGSLPVIASSPSRERPARFPVPAHESAVHVFVSCPARNASRSMVCLCLRIKPITSFPVRVGGRSPFLPSSAHS